MNKILMEIDSKKEEFQIQKQNLMDEKRQKISSNIE